MTRFAERQRRSGSQFLGQKRDLPTSAGMTEIRSIGEFLGRLGKEIANEWKAITHEGQTLPSLRGHVYEVQHDNRSVLRLCRPVGLMSQHPGEPTYRPMTSLCNSRRFGP